MSKTLPPGYPPPYDPTVWGTNLIKGKDCNVSQSDADLMRKYNINCNYQATASAEDLARNGISTDLAWSCPPGKFCLSANTQFNCTPGFYCPANTAIPRYCPPGFFCSMDTTQIYLCKQNYYCPVGTVDDVNGGPLTCGGGVLAYCPPGSKDVSKFGLAGIFLLISLFIYIGFNYKDKADKQRYYRIKKELELEEAKLHKVKTPLPRLSRTFNIEFENLGLVLPNGIEIMGNVTGKLFSGRVCAIMGPSGAGKTTFVTLLTGKQPRSSGHIMLNGKPDELSNYSKLIGYVPQEDIMLRDLTVLDILLHSASMRLPIDWSKESVKTKVFEIISFLGLSHVAQTIIGDEETRGISGGQRKRVNIGMELVAEPSVLFLDEPTSGLDSSTSFEVCANLREIAEQQGITIAAVIHSPSPATFKQFHDFLLLGKVFDILF